MKIVLYKEIEYTPARYFLQFISDENRIIFQKLMIKSRDEALNIIEQIQELSQEEETYVTKKSPTGKFYFTLKEEKEVGESDYFSTREELNSAISLMQEEAVNAEIEKEVEFTKG